LTVITDTAGAALPEPRGGSETVLVVEGEYASGYAENALAHHGIPESGISYLRKPFAPETLARRVRDVLDSSRGS